MLIQIFDENLNSLWLFVFELQPQNKIDFS